MANEFAVNAQDYIPAFKQMGLEIYTSAGTPTASGAAKGALVIDTTNAKIYQNTGTVASATWGSIGDIAAGEITLATGSILLGTADVGAALDAKASGQILVGNGTTVTSVAVSGDATLASTGALTVTDVTVGSDAAGDILYKSSATALTRLAKGNPAQGALAPQAKKLFFQVM